MSIKALLLSGGMDSYALAFMSKPDFALTINYGQRPAVAELQSAKLLTTRLQIPHIELSIDLSSLGSGDLSSNPPIQYAPASDWWPYRNQVLITLAAMRLIPLHVNELQIATVRNDSYHLDGSLGFINAMSNVLSLQEGNLTLRAPAISMTTVELIKASGIPYSLLAWSHSCHTANIACGQCRGCVKHREVVEELGYGRE